jgi:hypothetical protein
MRPRHSARAASTTTTTHPPHNTGPVSGLFLAVVLAPVVHLAVTRKDVAEPHA